jgi:hypothetical protein
MSFWIKIYASSAQKVTPNSYFLISKKDMNVTFIANFNIDELTCFNSIPYGIICFMIFLNTLTQIQLPNSHSI